MRFDQLTPKDLHDWDVLEAAETDPNPFLTPTWIGAWYEHRTAPSDQALFLVRHPVTDALLGVVPMYVKVVKLGPLRTARRLLPVGSGSTGPLELPGQLSAVGHHRDVTRAVVGTLVEAEVDWASISLAPHQGWLEPEHLLATSASTAFWQHIRSRACVVLPLASSWEEVRAGLKRNLKESLRRSRNRLAKSGSTYRVVQRTEGEVDDQAICRLFDLHRLRSGHGEAGVSHADAFAEPWVRALLRSTLPRLAKESRAALFELELDGRVVASQLVLHGPGSTYVHSSGFAPETWEFGPVTFLVEAVVRNAVQRGDRLVNFSPGPRVSKLRWSEEYWVSNEFNLGAGTDARLRRFRFYRALSTLSLDLMGLNVLRHGTS